MEKSELLITNKSNLSYSTEEEILAEKSDVSSENLRKLHHQDENVRKKSIQQMAYEDEIVYNLIGNSRELDLSKIPSPSYFLRKKGEFEIIDEEKASEAGDILSEYLYDFLIEHKGKPIDKKSVFVSKQIPNIQLEDYIKRISNYCRLEENELYYIGFLIDKCIQKGYIVRIETMYKLINSCLIITLKYLKDKRIRRKDLCKVTGEKLETLGVLEESLLQFLKYDIHINDSKIFTDFKSKLHSLHKH